MCLQGVSGGGGGPGSFAAYLGYPGHYCWYYSKALGKTVRLLYSKRIIIRKLLRNGKFRYAGRRGGGAIKSCQGA